MISEQKKILEAEGKRFRYFRRQAHLSIEEAAERLGISSRTLAAYERGERGISVTKAIEMAEAYDTTFSELTAYKRINKEIQ